MGEAAMFMGRNRVLFSFGVTAVIMMMCCFAMMVSGVLVMCGRGVMMFACGMFGFCHKNLLGFFIDSPPESEHWTRKATRVGFNVAPSQAQAKKLRAIEEPLCLDRGRLGTLVGDSGADGPRASNLPPRRR
jgi:hypothetical protein